MIFDLEKIQQLKKYWELREEKKSNDSDYLNKIFLMQLNYNNKAIQKED